MHNNPLSSPPKKNLPFGQIKRNPFFLSPEEKTIYKKAGLPTSFHPLITFPYFYSGFDHRPYHGCWGS